MEFPSGKTCNVTENSSVTARSLQEKLPLKITLEDYADTERIVYLDFKLKNDGSDGYKPHRGDLCYYAPWGNLAFFKNDFRYSK
ncbi:MAG: cyclophilin-like fold protein [Succinatimonas sp.]|nr:cyclophilin-like fold protein [Succinatimonas sp.]